MSTWGDLKSSCHRCLPGEGGGAMFLVKKRLLKMLGGTKFFSALGTENLLGCGLLGVDQYPGWHYGLTPQTQEISLQSLNDKFCILKKYFSGWISHL